MTFFQNKFRTFLCLALALALAAAIAPSGASAAFPGKPGRIAFSASNSYDGSSGIGIYTITPQGRDRRRIGSGSDPSYSPDGHHIVFSSGEGEGSSISIMGENGGHRHVAVRGGGEVGPSYEGSLDDPSFSPDGSRIVYVKGEREPGVWTASVHGGRRRRLVDGYSEYPSYSPNGRLIIFQQEVGSGRVIYTMRTNGTHVRTLVRGTHGSFSPNGRLIAYSRGGAIWTIHPDGTHKRLIMPSASNGSESLSAEYPSFSPNGNEIVFSRLYEGSAGNIAWGGGSRLWRIRLDGTHLQVITRELPEKVLTIRSAWQPLH